MVKIDSTVMTLGLSGWRLYVGGNFNSIKDGTGLDNPRAKAASLNAVTGEVELGWNPNPDKAIKDLLVSPDGSRIYLAGDFDKLGSTTRTRLAAVDPTTGAPTDWKPAPPDSVLKHGPLGGRVDDLPRPRRGVRQGQPEPGLADDEPTTSCGTSRVTATSRPWPPRRTSSTSAGTSTSSTRRPSSAST